MTCDEIPEPFAATLAPMDLNTYGRKPTLRLFCAAAGLSP